MTVGEPHPQRCATCSNESCEYWMYRNEWFTDGNHRGSAGAITWIVGCASHSSPAAAPVPDCEKCEIGWGIASQKFAEQARKDEREKVLDKIIDRLLSDKSGLETNRDSEASFWRSTGMDVKIGVYENILKYVESLRREGEQHG